MKRERLKLTDRSQSPKRPAIDELRKQVKDGADLCTVIGSVLSKDADVLFSGKERGTLISDDILTLYDIKLSEIENLDFLEGFMTATFWYSLFVMLKNNPSNASRMKPTAGKKGDNLTEEEFEKMLEDPSGVTWMKKNLKDHYREKGQGFDGASRAISGVENFYQMITDPSVK